MTNKKEKSTHVQEQMDKKGLGQMLKLEVGQTF